MKLKLTDSVNRTNSSHLEDMVTLDINYDISSIAGLFFMPL
jgi:hypothetical protein